MSARHWTGHLSPSTPRVAAATSRTRSTGMTMAATHHRRRALVLSIALIAGLLSWTGVQGATAEDDRQSSVKIINGQPIPITDAPWQAPRVAPTRTVSKIGRASCRERV